MLPPFVTLSSSWMWILSCIMLHIATDVIAMLYCKCHFSCMSLRVQDGLHVFID